MPQAPPCSRSGCGRGVNEDDADDADDDDDDDDDADDADAETV